MPNPHPWIFTDLLTRQPEGSVCLDLGSGGRSLPGVISLDREAHPNNTVCGDCLSLPFKDNCADLILSQAVIEHVTDPDLAFKEMYRVLKPGGTLYVEIAFMQPVHQAPHHYFNVTPYGLRYLLRDWDIEGTSTVGTPDDVLGWIEKTYRSPTRSRRHNGKSISTTHYELAASGVSALARKPIRYDP